MIEEQDENNTESARNVYGRNLITRETDVNKIVYGFNGHSDVIYQASLGGVVLVVYDYDEFGNVVLEENVVNSVSTFAPSVAGPGDTAVETPTYSVQAIDNPYRYAGYEYIEEVKLYDLNARYYNPEIARFLSADPYYNLGNRVIGLYEINMPNAWSIIQANNVYVYCGNSPVIFVDPFGLDSYLFYVPDVFGKDTGTQCAITMKLELESVYGEPCHLIPMTSYEDFVDGWESMGIVNGNTVDIDTVLILAHGSHDGFSFDGKKKAKQDTTPKNTDTKKKRFSKYDIANLSQKEIDMLVLISCNSGCLTFNLNLATTFAKKDGVKKVVASDGDIEATTVDLLYFKHLKYESVPNDIYHKHKNNEGFFVFQYDSSKEKVVTTAIGYKFNGIISLINVSKKV